MNNKSYSFREIWDLFNSPECIGAYCPADNVLLTIGRCETFPGKGFDTKSYLTFFRGQYEPWFLILERNNAVVNELEKGFRLINYDGENGMPVILEPVIKMPGTMRIMFRNDRNSTL